MILEILQDGDKRLLKKSKRVAKIDKTIKELAENLVSTMKSAGGIGISAPQVGVLKQVIVVLVNNEPKVMINPEIIFESEEKVTAQEGCLSFTGEFYEIPRAKEVTVKYRTIEGFPMLETHTDLVARCLLHEIDHLNGVVFKSYLDT
jgi:peptide deformylase